MCCSEIADSEGIPLYHMVAFWLPACLLLLCLLLLCSVRGDAALKPGVLLHFLLGGDLPW